MHGSRLSRDCLRLLCDICGGKNIIWTWILLPFFFSRSGLLVGLEETEGSVLCLYDLGLSRVVKAVVIPGRVSWPVRIQMKCSFSLMLFTWTRHDRKVTAAPANRNLKHIVFFFSTLIWYPDNSHWAVGELRRSQHINTAPSPESALVLWHRCCGNGPRSRFAGGPLPGWPVLQPKWTRSLG